ncbi:MAG TPA: Crp/Fnr family transcriptional regulator [Longimicrobiales bacterium]
MKNHDTRNWILRSLADDQRERILAAAELVELPKKRLLYDINQPIHDVYFIETGVSSILSLLLDGTAVETSTCGREGMVGLPLFLGAQTASTQAMQQIPGSGWRLPRAVFLEELQRDGGKLRELLGRLTLATMTLVAQNSACNRRHSVEERCVRWLLTSHDQMDRQPFELTHQFLSQMLGVRRATVTVTAGALQQAGLVNYHRGLITITNREGLEDIVCECYKIIHNEYARQLGVQELIDDPIAKMDPSDGKFSTVADGA